MPSMAALTSTRVKSSSIEAHQLYKVVLAFPMVPQLLTGTEHYQRLSFGVFVYCSLTTTFSIHSENRHLWTFPSRGSAIRTHTWEAVLIRRGFAHQPLQMFPKVFVDHRQSLGTHLLTKDTPVVHPMRSSALRERRQTHQSHWVMETWRNCRIRHRVGRSVIPSLFHRWGEVTDELTHPESIDYWFMDLLIFRKRDCKRRLSVIPKKRVRWRMGKKWETPRDRECKV